jgi:hypothetical protein
MSGGRGGDILTGGPNADTFDFNLSAETPKGAGHDVITDFSGILGAVASRRSVHLHQRQTVVRLACRGQRRRGPGHPRSTRRNRKAALKLMRKLLKKQGVTPATNVTDKLGSYSSALRELGVARRHDTGRW